MLALQQANLFSKETSQPLKPDYFSSPKYRSQAISNHRGNRSYVIKLSFWRDLYTQFSRKYYYRDHSGTILAKILFTGQKELKKSWTYIFRRLQNPTGFFFPASSPIFNTLLIMSVSRQHTWTIILYYNSQFPGSCSRNQ